ncbi:type IV secretory system conjugative DNA transfer family protein [Sphingomonas sp. AOB5]|uniref:type IV secretory system conjugative DNA transfer family protein n=1 Tax=Sphingomonas sp. AOB5 TaxID=3034017 RepID=UPI0023F62458|nr:type IV secretory system conjugative DNA transfer family protein [Sphingomonas sp. AOB5]MDF7776484.1 type IV secretory system conjugative DNA transfer family protein [Sphingomonas sp. AOB5]
MSAKLPFGSNADTGRAVRLPEKVDEAGLLVGWSLERDHARPRFGFGYGDPAMRQDSGILDPVLLDGEGHLITFAPTGQGKGRSCIIPALLRHSGPVIVIDPKGENVQVTARRRRELGQQVVVLDPMCVASDGSGRFNPLDLIDGESVDGVDLAAMFAAAMVDGKEDPENRYWYQRGQQLLIGVILHVVTTAPHGGRTFTAVREALARLVSEAGDPVPMPGSMRHELEHSPHPEARMAATILAIGVQQGVGSILSMAQDGIDFLRGPQVATATAASDFDIDAVTRGDPLSIYIVLPPHMMESHGRLLRLWIMALISLITRRRARPERSTLFLLDEAAQLGTLPQLRQAVTLLRGYGVQTWSFWQDVSQLRLLYPRDWETMLNNCEVVQCFGALNMRAAATMAEITGYGLPAAVLGLTDDEMLLQIAGEEVVVARKPDYLNDPAFKGAFDANPFHDSAREVLPPPSPRIKLFERRPDGPPSRPPAQLATVDAPEPPLLDDIPFFTPPPRKRERRNSTLDDLAKRITGQPMPKREDEGTDEAGKG